jgi:hypothetical protein
MGLRRKYRTKSELSRPHSSSASTNQEALDKVGMTEAMRAASAAITALADTLNALVLRIALWKNTDANSRGSEQSCKNRLALLAESASGQVRGIQKLLQAIELTTQRNESKQTREPH